MRDPGHRAELVGVIGQVRNRWRLKLALKGAVVVVGGSLLALLLSASGLEALRFSAGAIIAFRILVAAVFAALAALWLLRPLMRRVSDAQVALYLEEQDRSLETAILSAIEAAESEPDRDSPHSRALVDRLVEQAIEKCRSVDYGHTIEGQSLRRQLMMLASVVAAVTLLLVFGPAFLRHGFSALLVLSRSAEAASPYRIDVVPGNATIPRGSDQAVKAKLFGFQAAQAELMLRKAPDAAFERVPLVPTGEPLAFEGILFHLDNPIDYYVASNGVRSPMFTLTLVDLPAVSKLELEYHYPAYTGLPPQKIEDGGDVAALRGTEVRVSVEPTMATPSGRLLLNDSAASPLARQPDGSLTGSFKIERQGFYRVELEGPRGEHVTASPQYMIDVLDDRPPAVSFTKPGRDTQASPVEELFLEARAEDDFGVKHLDLVYTVNGGHEKTVKLFGGAKPLAAVSAGHTIYLENLGLTAGDFVSYYARAADTDAVQGPNTASSDIYFVKIRPYRKDYRRAPSQAMGGGQGGPDVGQLSEQQRQIVAATFNVVRDRAKMSADKFRENTVFLTLAESKLREQVDELVQKMSSREVDRDPSFKRIADLLAKASPDMKAAEAELRKQLPKAAMLPEQSALKYLQQAEQEYENVRVDSKWRRRWWWSERVGGGSRGPLRAGARQAGQPVRDATARRAAEWQSADRRARRETEGTGAAATAGSRAATAHGGQRPERVGRRRQPASDRRGSRRGSAQAPTTDPRTTAARARRRGAAAAGSSRRHAAGGSQWLA